MPDKSSSSVKVFWPRYSTAEVVGLLRAKLPEIEAITPVKVFALFGSYAKGNYTVASDIDVLLLYGGPTQEDAYLKIRPILNIPGIELHLYSEEECRSLGSTIDRMLKDSIAIKP